ncbi:MAG: ABC transporter permease [Flavobacteriales bacterium]
MFKRFSNSSLYLNRIQLSLTAKVGLTLIILLSLASFSGAYLRPDKTPMANHQFRTLARLKPMTSVEFLKVKKNLEVEGAPWYDQFFLGGREPEFELVPFDEIEFQDHRVKLKLRSTLGVEEYRFYSFIDILYPVNSEIIAAYISLNDNHFKFVDALGNDRSVDVEAAKLEIQSAHIERNTFLLGTDQFGRDMLSRLMAGSIATITIAFLSVAIAFLFGVGMGLIAGFYGGLVDRFLSWIINVFWSVPPVLLVIAITMLIGQGAFGTLVGIGLIIWVEMAQVVRGEVIAIRNRDFVKAAHLMGLSDGKIILQHILPNVRNSIVVLSIGNFSEAVLLESGMSFLGAGIQPPVPSWGSMLRESYGYIITDSAYMPIFPGLAIVILVLSFGALGKGFGTNLRESGSSQSIAAA